MNYKKASMTHEQIFKLSVIIVILGVVAGLYLSADLVLNDTTFERSILSKDISFFLDTISSSHSNIDYDYNASIALEDYDFCVSGKTLKIAEHDKQLFVAYNFYLPQDKELKFGNSPPCLLYPKTISIKRSSDKIAVGQNIEKIDTICPIHRTDLESPVILLDPIHTEDDLTDLISSSISDLLAQNQIEVTTTRPGSIAELSLEERKQQTSESEANIVISLNQKTKMEGSQEVNVYYNPDIDQSINSSYLSCLITKNIQEETNLKITTIPISSNALHDAEERSTLSIPRLNIFIEMHESEDSEQKLISTYPKIAKAISDGIKEYTQ